MAILVNPATRVDQWMAEFREVLPDEELRVWPDIGDAADIEYLIAWVMSAGEVASLSNVQAILCLGAGTEQWQQIDMPAVPVVRLVDPAMANQMTAYALAWVIRHQRDFARAEAWQRAGTWKIPPHAQPWQYRVGLLGYGEIGSTIGRAFAGLDYQVNAWTRTARDHGAASTYAGFDQLAAFLGNSDAVINVLPSTEETNGLLTAARFDQFTEGSVFVNIGRGSVLHDEAELIAALDHGPLAAAVLDVTNPEPPVDGSPLYTHPAVTLTAHLSGTTQVRSAARLIADNVARLRAGQEPFPVLDRSRGY